MEYRILGPLEVWEDDRPVAIGGGRQRTLLALLILNANEVASRERLIDALWPEHPPESADKILQNHVSVLRKVLPDGALATRGRGYQLNVHDGELDLHRFQALREEGRNLLDADSPRDASEKLGQALALWRGKAFADCRFDSFDKAEVAGLEELRLGAIEERIEADLAAGRHTEVVGELESLVAQHPYRERFWEQLMLARYRCGRAADALAAYRDAHRALDGLGLEPGPSLRRLEKAILTHDPALDLPVPEAVELKPEVAAGRRRRRLYAGSALFAVIAAIVAISILMLGDESSMQVAPNSVAVIDPATNTVVDSVPVGVGPGGVAVGGGSVWVTNLDDQTLSRIDPKTRAVVKNIPLDATPTGVAVGAGAVWVVNGLIGTVSRVDPGFESISATIPAGQRSYSGSIAVGGGAVWATLGDGTVVRIDPRSNLVVGHALAGFAPSAVAIGQDGVWVANRAENTVSRLSLRTNSHVRTFTVGRSPSAVAVGGGAAWVANQGNDSVTRIDPDSNSIAGTISVGRGPLGVAFGGGAVWVANSEEGTVSRIDPATSKVVAVIEVGHHPVAIAFGAGAVWVAVQRLPTT